MNCQQVIKTFGRISYQLVSAMVMHAENMARQQHGLSVAYTEKQFDNICTTIKKITKEL